MTRFLIIALALALAPLAIADSEHTCIGNSNCSNNTDNSTANTAVNAPVTTNVNTAVGGAGGDGGNASNTNVIGVSNTAKIERGAVDIETKNLNNNFNLTHVGVESSNTNKQKQQQGQIQGQSQSQKINDSGNSSIVWTDRVDVAQAYAAAAVNGACGNKSAGIGAQGTGFGASLSIPFGGELCEGLAMATWLTSAGYKAEAVRLLCRKDDDFAEVMGSACTPTAE